MFQACALSMLVLGVGLTLGTRPGRRAWPSLPQAFFGAMPSTNAEKAGSARCACFEYGLVPYGAWVFPKRKQLRSNLSAEQDIGWIPEFCSGRLLRSIQKSNKAATYRHDAMWQGALCCSKNLCQWSATVISEQGSCARCPSESQQSCRPEWLTSTRQGSDSKCRYLRVRNSPVAKAPPFR